MEKLDLTKEYKAYFSAAAHPEIVSIEAARYLSILGKGDPSGAAFAERLQALYSTAYAVKFKYKALDKDFTVSKLEGQWWYDENKHPGYSMGDTPASIPREEWFFRLLIRLPSFVKAEHITQARESVVNQKGIVLGNEVTLFEMEEGLCIQMMHIGPFSTEPETLRKMAVLIREKKFLKNGLHHEIYLSDFRKTAPEKLKTILREPVRLG